MVYHLYTYLISAKFGIVVFALKLDNADLALICDCF